MYVADISYPTIVYLSRFSVCGVDCLALLFGFKTLVAVLYLVILSRNPAMWI